MYIRMECFQRHASHGLSAVRCRAKHAFAGRLFFKKKNLILINSYFWEKVLVSECCV